MKDRNLPFVSMFEIFLFEQFLIYDVKTYKSETAQKKFQTLRQKASFDPSPEVRPYGV